MYYILTWILVDILIGLGEHDELGLAGAARRQDIAFPVAPRRVLAFRSRPRHCRGLASAGRRVRRPHILRRWNMKEE